MGYTNYWTPDTDKPVPSDNRKFMMAFTKEAIRLSELKICGGDGFGEPSITEENIYFNGDASKGEDHETFALEMRYGVWEFCKTNRKPYDALVKACLIMAKRLDILSVWSFDGDPDETEYQEALELTKMTLKSFTENPKNASYDRQMAAYLLPKLGDRECEYLPDCSQVVLTKDDAWHIYKCEVVTDDKKYKQAMQSLKDQLADYNPYNPVLV
jgi:hypothetical protein